MFVKNVRSIIFLGQAAEVYAEPGQISKMELLSSEAVAQRFSVKKMFLEISKNTFSYRIPPVAASEIASRLSVA